LTSTYSSILKKNKIVINIFTIDKMINRDKWVKLRIIEAVLKKIKSKKTTKKLKRYIKVKMFLLSYILSLTKVK
jgi:hypothetical protein